MANTNLKRTLSIIMIMVMLLSSFNLSVFAADQVNLIENFEDSYYHQDGTAANANDWEIHLSKTAAVTNDENVYEITLLVETKDTSIEMAGATHGAVALVLDASNSMGEAISAACVACGENENHKNHRILRNACPDGSGDTYDRRGPFNSRCENCGEAQDSHRDIAAACEYQFAGTHMDVLKEAVKDFLDSYVKDAAQGDKRLVSIVEFYTNASTVQGWIDVNNDANMAAVKAAIDNVSTSHYSEKTDMGGTNMEAGLVLGRNLLKADTLKDIPAENQSLILFSDGAPTAAVGNVNSTSTTSVAYNGNDTGFNADAVDRDDLDDILADIDVKKLAVAYNTDAALLKSLFGNNNVITSSAGSLALDLASSAGSIITTTTNAGAITDPMGTGISMITVTTAYDAEEKTWNLGEFTPVINNGVTTYTIKYQIEIDPTAVNADADLIGYTVLTPANGTTTFNYTVGDSTALISVDFNEPNVRGIIPAYTLTVNYEDEAGVALADSHITNNLLHGTVYTTEQQVFEGYTFEEVVGDAAAGTMNSDKEVTYVYSKNPVYFNLVVNWEDEDGVALEAALTETLEEGTAYTTEQKFFNGYTFKEVVGDAVLGTMDADKEVTYVYTKNPVYFNLVVNYVDEAGEALLNPTTDTLEEGTAYTTEQKAIEGYSFK